MAAQVLSGSGPVSYTNSTGQNVRLVINYLEKSYTGGEATLSFPGTSITIDGSGSPGGGPIYGKSIAYKKTGGGNENPESQNAWSTVNDVVPIPLEIALANGETFSITGLTPAAILGYNIIIIPEAG